MLTEFMTNNDVPGFLALWRGRCQSFRLLAAELRDQMRAIYDATQP